MPGAQGATARQRIRRLEAADEGALLAEALGTVLPLAHADPVACAHEVTHRGLQRGARAVGARREPRDCPDAADDMAVQYLGLSEFGHGSWKKVLHQQLHNVLVRHAGDGTGIVEVACQYRALRLLAPPERLLVILELVQHEERAPRAPEALEAREDVRGCARGHVAVEPDPGGHHVDTAQRCRPGKLRYPARHAGAAAHEARHALGA
mmetsp:Transcript_125754/g.367496  ORF Transcript_125754/g.367496 Transcript_125754/m.367496 type:complete len:208 (-) Transcript_125754:898-1521(-)